jgi:hypothetical protein
VRTGTGGRGQEQRREIQNFKSPYIPVFDLQSFRFGFVVKEEVRFGLLLLHMLSVNEKRSLNKGPKIELVFSTAYLLLSSLGFFGYPVICFEVFSSFD